MEIYVVYTITGEYDDKQFDIRYAGTNHVDANNVIKHLPKENITIYYAVWEDGKLASEYHKYFEERWERNAGKRLLQLEYNLSPDIYSSIAKRVKNMESPQEVYNEICNQLRDRADLVGTENYCSFELITELAQAASEVKKLLKK